MGSRLLSPEDLTQTFAEPEFRSAFDERLAHFLNDILNEERGAVRDLIPAGVMAELELPRERLVSALLGFNLGVGLGQLVVVAAVWPVLRTLARVGGASRLRSAEVLGSAAVAALGSYWLLGRVFA